MQRDHRIDSLKGLLIILVILGHVIIEIDNINVINHAVMGGIYVFHMPLFILISGYLTRPHHELSQRQLWKGVGNLLVTIVIFQVLSMLRHLPQGKDPIAMLLEFPYGILWYLMSLIYWRLIIYYTPQWLLKRPVAYLSLAFLLSILSGLTHLGNFLAIQRTLNFYPFFLLGYYYKQGAISDRWWKNYPLHAAVALIMLPLILWLYPHCGNVLNGADHYTLSGIPQKVLTLITSTATSLLVFNMVGDFKWLRPIGKDSLFYYLYHIYLLMIIVAPTVERYNLPHSLPFMLLYTAIILGTLLLMHKVKFFRWLTNPLKSHHGTKPQSTASS